MPRVVLLPHGHVYYLQTVGAASFHLRAVNPELGLRIKRVCRGDGRSREGVKEISFLADT